MNKRFARPLTSSLAVAAMVALLGTPGSAPAQTNAGSAGANAITNPTARLEELFGDSVVAKGKGVEVKRSQLDAEVINLKAAAAAHGQAVSPEQTGQLELQVLEQMIGSQLLLTQATDADRAKGREQFATSLQKLKEGSKLSDADFNDKLSLQIKMQGLTREQWDKRLIDQATVPAVLERELKVKVGDDEVKKYFDEHPSRFEEPEMVRVSHILISTTDPTTSKPLTDAQKMAKHKQIEELLKRARAGEDFAKLAKENSEDPGSRDNGGEYTFPRGQMVPEFEAAAFSLNTNQVSDIVTTQYGYHILKLNEKIPATKLEFAKVAGDLKDGLKQQQLAKLAPAYIETLRKDADVQILDEKMKAREDLLKALAVPAAPDTAEPSKPVEKK